MSCTHADCLCHNLNPAPCATPKPAALEVLGVTVDDRVAFRWHLPNGAITDEIELTEHELTTLTRALLDDPAQPLWPRETCHHCDTDAIVQVYGQFLCHAHALAQDAIEEGT